MSARHEVTLGVSISHDAGAALLVDGALVAAANEERFNRRKAYFGLPEQSIHAVLKVAAIDPAAVTNVALANLVHLPQPVDGDIAAPEGRPLMFWPAEVADRIGVSRALLGTQLGIHVYREVMPLIARHFQQQLRKLLLELGVRAPVSTWDHHATHLAGAYYDRPWSRALLVSNDGFGDGYCARVSVGDEGRIEDRLAIPLYHSLGAYYNYVTRLCGFPKYYHAGKVTGLAAYGDPNVTLPLFRSRIAFENGTYVNRGGLFRNEYRYLERRLAGVERQHMAAGVQRHLEDVLVEFVSEWMSRTGVRRIGLSGGVHANVKANQRILAIPGVEEIWVHPHMGDGGLATGAAYLQWASGGDAANRPRVRPLEHAYLGPEYTASECEAALLSARVRPQQPPDLARAVAERLAAGKVVARFAGRMEYGPRALGNRSILCPATDSSINDSLNARLKRSEFMPFAPVLRDVHAAAYLKGYDCRSAAAAEFMTITYDVTPRCAAEAPAVVHVDGTARPQVLRRAVNPEYYRILEEYEQLTGLNVLVNTSFNMHEEPIVCSPADAVRAFLQGHLDALALGPFLVDQPSS